jgi:hypothetical protein
VPDSKEVLAIAKSKLKPAITTSQFAVFVFGPTVSDAFTEPSGAVLSHDDVLKHAAYIRLRTRERLREIGFAADFGEAADIRKFWQNFLRSPNAAATEVLHARHICGAIVILPASIGSIAELALFAQKGEISQKTVAIVHQGFQGASSFFRRGLLEIFTIFSGRREFVDYSDHEACITEAVSFVEGQYYRLMEEKSDLDWLASRNLGSVFDHALESGTD